MFQPLPTPMLRHALLTLSLLPVGAALAADPPSAPPAKDPVIASVNGTKIHESDVESLRADLGPKAAAAPYEQLRDRLIAEALIDQAARAEKLDADPEVKKSIARMQARVLIQEYMHRAIDKAESDAAIKAKFNEMSKAASTTEEVKARHILVKTEDEAKAIIVELDKGADFAKLADEKSEDKGGGETGGELGYFTKDKMVPEFADAAFAMKPGEHSKVPVKSKFGWHVILVEDRRAAPPPTLEEMKPQIQQQIASDLVTSKIDSLKKAAKIEEFNEDGSAVSAKPPEPAALSLAPPK
jgi:peptidyl-prolyl cis-trans isomerase C